MSLSRWQRSAMILSILLPGLLILAGCGDATTRTPTPTKAVPTSTPTPGPGQVLLNKMADKINTAKTLHGLFNLSTTGQAVSGSAKTEIWRGTAGKSRAEVQQSTISQVSEGSVVVSDGKQIWQYDPAKNIVYNGPVTASDNNAQSNSFGGSAGQSQFLLSLIQTIFTHSDGTLRASSANIAGHNVDDIHVVPQGGNDSSNAGSGSFSYKGEVYIDKASQLPVQINLEIQGLGNVVVDIPELELNQTLADSLFTFATPAGAKVEPLQNANTGTDSGALNLAQAQQQAGYNLFSIPGEQTNYVLQSVTALGAPGSQTYSLHYMKGNLSFTIAEGKPLANLPVGSGQKVPVRGTTATLTTTNGTSTLAWTEKGIGIRITGALNLDQLNTIANLLA